MPKLKLILIIIVTLIIGAITGAAISSFGSRTFPEDSSVPEVRYFPSENGFSRCAEKIIHGNKLRLCPAREFILVCYYDPSAWDKVRNGTDLGENFRYKSCITYFYKLDDFE